MSHLHDAVPSSLRAAIEPSRFVQDLATRSNRPTYLPAAGNARAVLLSKSRFARLPQEPEDARLTGVTRSLNRRLLALNVNGSLSKRHVVPLTRIA